jgi:hypothetical protein
MGNAHVLRGRMAPALILAALLVVVAVVALGAFARPAAAQTTFTQCSTCHDYAYGDAYHNMTTHKAQACATCHVNGPGKAGLVPSACASCHGPVSTLIATTNHAPAGCGTTNGCHGYVSPTPTPTPTPTATVAPTTMTAKVSPAIVKLGKKVKVTGLAGPVPALVGAKVAFKVERKVGAKWTKMKTGTATTSATGAYTWSYKAIKKGPHRVKVSIAKTTAFTAKALVKNFKVK